MMAESVGLFEELAGQSHGSWVEVEKKTKNLKIKIDN